jgi:hypothetical protein
MNTVRGVRELREQTVQTLYRLGLELGPNESATVKVVAADNSRVAVVVRPSGGGVVEVRCEDESICAHLRNFVGLDVKS